MRTYGTDHERAVIGAVVRQAVERPGGRGLVAEMPVGEGSTT